MCNVPKRLPHQTKMLRRANLLGIFLILPVAFSIKVVREGNSFVHYIETDGHQLKSCILSLKNDNITLFPNQIHKTSNPIKYKIESYNKRACGFKLKNFGEQDPKKFNLTASFKDNSSVLRSYLVVEYRERPVLKNITDYTIYGDNYDLKWCRFDREKGCALYAPSGEVVTIGTDYCGFQVKDVSREHIGRWKCDILFQGDVTATSFYIDLGLFKQPRIETWYKKENGYGKIGCKYADRIDNAPLKSCTMRSPHKQILNIEENSATDRYDSLGTNYKENICEFEFELPAQENEIGTWTCILDRRRGFVNVEHASNYPKYQKIFAKPNQQRHVECDVPYPAITSFAVDPSGQVFYKASYNDSQDGKLYFYIQSSNLTESRFGDWQCHFAKNNTYEDEIITVNIEKFGGIIPKLKDVDIEESDELLILFASNTPISYCTIEDPQGNIYHIQPSTKTPTLEYYGAGFDHGECGIKIRNVTSGHKGSWKCMTSNGHATDGNKQSFANTHVDVMAGQSDGLLQASSASILIGFVFAVLTATAIILYGKFKYGQQKQRISPANSFGDENSEETFVLRQISH